MPEQSVICRASQGDPLLQTGNGLNFQSSLSQSEATWQLTSSPLSVHDSPRKQMTDASVGDVW